MREYAAQMPSSVKRFTKTGQSHAFCDPAPILLADFALPAFSLNPYPSGNHLSSTSQFFYHNIPFLSVGIYFTSMWKYFCFSYLLLFSASFLTVAQLLNCSMCLRAALQVLETFAFCISTTFCCGLLWKLRMEKGREHVLMGECSSFVLSSRTNFLFSYKFCGRLMEGSCSPGLKWCSTQLSKKELVYCRNYLMVDHLQPQATFFSPCVCHCQRYMGLIP